MKDHLLECKNSKTVLDRPGFWLRLSVENSRESTDNLISFIKERIKISEIILTCTRYPYPSNTPPLALELAFYAAKWA